MNSWGHQSDLNVETECVQRFIIKRQTKVEQSLLDFALFCMFLVGKHSANGIILDQFVAVLMTGRRACGVPHSPHPSSDLIQQTQLPRVLGTLSAYRGPAAAAAATALLGGAAQQVPA